MNEKQKKIENDDFIMDAELINIEKYIWAMELSKKYTELTKI